MHAMTGPLPYDVLVLLSFGGPEGQDDVVPFLRNVTRGRGIPDERLEAVGEHYRMFGGRSPINDQNRALLAALRTELDARGIDLPLVWGNRNWAPYLVDTLREAHEAGARRALVAHHERLLLLLRVPAVPGGPRRRRDRARGRGAGARGRPGPPLRRDERVRGGQRRRRPRGPGRRPRPRARTTSRGWCSSPTRCRPRWTTPPARTGTRTWPSTRGSRRPSPRGRGRTAYDLVYCSRSGPPTQPWLEPDVNDHLEDLAGRGTRAVVLAPIGFVSDHMEVVYDLDTEAAATCERLGLRMQRAATVGTDPGFVRALVDLVAQRCGLGPGPTLDAPGLPSVHDVCPVGCCRNLRGDRPAACGADWEQPAVADA